MVLIVDYGMGNLASVRRSFEECGARILISGDPRDAKEATHLVIPGVGAFSVAMNRLRQRGWLDVLIEKGVVDRLPILGICLGMQLLASQGEEGGVCPGIGLIAGRVVRLVPNSGERVPHVGWNEVCAIRPSPLLQSIDPKADFYFVHSYHFIPVSESDIVATTPFCGSFVSIVNRENIFGVQFHPEKSSSSGFQLVRNFLSM